VDVNNVPEGQTYADIGLDSRIRHESPGH
jgi:hypothetical protein